MSDFFKVLVSNIVLLPRGTNNIQSQIILPNLSPKRWSFHFFQLCGCRTNICRGLSSELYSTVCKISLINMKELPFLYRKALWHINNSRTFELSLKKIFRNIHQMERKTTVSQINRTSSALPRSKTKQRLHTKQNMRIEDSR